MKNPRLVILPLLAAGLLVATASLADAQRHRPRRTVVVRTSVLVGGFWYPRYYYDPLLDAGYPYGPFGLYPPYGYGYGYGYDRRDMTSSLRLQVSPSDTQVFVDGYAAGEVDEFDGIFQRLRVSPGGHEIVLYHEGYRTLRENLYLRPGADQKIKHELVPLGAGETAELPPPPENPPAVGADDGARRVPPRRGSDAEPRRPEPPPRERAARFGTLSVRMQPRDAELVVDGEPWTAARAEDRISVQLAEGRHHIEVRQAGFATYTEEVLIRANNTLTLNVSLLRE